MNEFDKSMYINNTTSSEAMPKKKKGNAKLIIIVIFIFLLLACLGVLVYYKVVSSKNIFKILINDTFTYLESNIQESDAINGSFELKVSGTSSDNSVNDMLGVISKVELTGNYGIDYKSKLMNLDIFTKYENDKLMNANIYTEDSNGYIMLEDIYDKYIKVPVDDYDSLFSFGNKRNDYKIVLKSINKALNDSLKDKYFVKEKLSIDGNKTNKITLKLTEDNYNLIKKDFINILLNNNEFLDSISSITNKSVDEIKEVLSDTLENEEFEGVDISIYTKGVKNEFVKLEIADANDSIRITKNKDKYDYEILEDKEVIYDGSISIEENSSKVFVKFSINETENNNNVEITFNSNTKQVDSIDKKDITNNIYYEELTDEDNNNMLSKILKNDTIMKFIGDISKSSNVFGSDSDYNIDDYSIAG